MTYLPHLIELRQRLIRSLGFVAIVFAASFYYSHDLFGLLAKPLLPWLPMAQGMIATTLTASFLVPLKLAAWLAVILTMPYLLYQLWGFVIPALFPGEKRFACYLLIGSIGLFYLGLLFAYGIVLPMIFRFFTAMVPMNVTLMPEIQAYFSFTLSLLFTFGLVFEVPIVILSLVFANLLSRRQLAQARPYVILLAFILGMLLTPPDVFSQLLLALPIWGLYELTQGFLRLIRLSNERG